jgi:hypothetical protein
MATSLKSGLCKLLIILGLINLNLYPENRVPQDDFVPGWRRAEHKKVFARKELFNYIDGGAELFLEFGFDNLVIQRYQKGNSELTLEAYQTESPESALGIYLVKCGKETPVEGIEARNSGEKTQFTILKGRYFIHINNFERDEKLLSVMVALARQVLESIPEEKPAELFDYLPSENVVHGSERLIRGPHALQSMFTFGEGDIFQLEGKIFGVAASYKDEKDDLFAQIIIPYPDKLKASAAYQNLLANLDPFLKTLKTWEGGFSFIDYSKKFGIVEIKGSVLKIRVNLASEPAFLK